MEYNTDFTECHNHVVLIDYLVSSRRESDCYVADLDSEVMASSLLNRHFRRVSTRPDIFGRRSVKYLVYFLVCMYALDLVWD